MTTFFNGAPTGPVGTEWNWSLTDPEDSNLSPWQYIHIEPDNKYTNGAPADTNQQMGNPVVKIVNPNTEGLAPEPPRFGGTTTTVRML